MGISYGWRQVQMVRTLFAMLTLPTGTPIPSVIFTTVPALHPLAPALEENALGAYDPDGKCPCL